MIDLLIAGGGPAGLATAIMAAQAGLEVVVAEPRTGPVDKACGEGLMPPALARLRELGVDPAGWPLRGIRYLDATHSADALFRKGIGRGVRRTSLQSALVERAREVGVKILPERVSDLESGWQDAANSSGLDHISACGLRARYLVAADGLHSPIRKACGLDPPPPRRPRFGLRRHYRIAPWADLVEVHWAAESEAYVTPVSDQLVGVAILGSGSTSAKGGFDARLAAFPALAERLVGAPRAGPDRGAGPLRQDVRRRTASKVLLVGDASGYVDALTGEGISVALAQAAALVDCVVTGRVAEYERRWLSVTRTSRLLTAGLLWTRHRPMLAGRIAPAAQALPPVFSGLVERDRRLTRRNAPIHKTLSVGVR